MKYKKFKLFLNQDSAVKCQYYDEIIGYYNFLKQNYLQGCRQIIITSDMMIRLIMYFVFERDYQVFDINLKDDDNEELLDLIGDDPKKLVEFLVKLNNISEKSAIEIQKSYFKGRTNGAAVNFFIQSNGILGVNEHSSDTITREISEVVERYVPR